VMVGPRVSYWEALHSATLLQTRFDVALGAVVWYVLPDTQLARSAQPRLVVVVNAAV